MRLRSPRRGRAGIRRGRTLRSAWKERYPFVCAGSPAYPAAVPHARDAAAGDDELAVAFAPDRDAETGDRGRSAASADARRGSHPRVVVAHAMRAAITTGEAARPIEIREIPTPEPGSNQ